MRPLRSLLAVALTAPFCPASAQAATTAVFAAPQVPQPRAMAPSALAPFGLARGVEQHLAFPSASGAPFELAVVLDGVLETLVLAPHSLRADGYQLLVQDASGALVPAQRSEPTTYRGHVAGRPGSFVAASLLPAGVSALVSLDGGTEHLWGIEPLPPGQGGEPTGRHLVYDDRDALFSGATCGVEGFPSAAPPGAGSVAGGASAWAVCEIACDADFEFFQLNGSSIAATEADIEGVLNGVEAIYATEVQILYSLTAIIVRTAEPDPYSTSNPSGLLNQVEQHWITSQGAIQRDVAHLFTGKNLDSTTIGIANIGAICSLFGGYGLSQSRYTSSQGLRVRLTAHELGHNWSALHCNNLLPDCGIMCQGGCGSATSFGTQSIASILAEKASAGCLGALEPPNLLALEPAALPTWGAREVQLSGDDLSSATSVELDGVATTDFALLPDGRLALVLDPPTALGTVQVGVANDAGLAPALPLVWTDNAELQVEGPGNLFFQQPATWSFGSGAGDLAFFAYSFSPDVVPFAGFDVLAMSNIAPLGPLGPNGLGEFVVIGPPLPIFTLLYTQIATTDGVELQVSDVLTTVSI